MHGKDKIAASLADGSAGILSKAYRAQIAVSRGGKDIAFAEVGQLAPGVGNAHGDGSVGRGLLLAAHVVATSQASIEAGIENESTAVFKLQTAAGFAGDVD